MKLQIISINDRGIPNQEKVILRVLQNCNAMYFSVGKTAYTGPNNISSNLEHIFWFPQSELKAGDYIWLFTGNGNYHQHSNTSNTMTHVHYWALSQTIFNNPDSCAVLFEINDWQTSLRQ